MRTSPAGWLYALAGAAFALASLLWILPTRLAAPVGSASPVRESASSTPPARSAAQDAYESIVQNNLFAQDRRPPGTRYTPRTERDPTTARASSSTTSWPRLYGIARGPSGTVALIDADRTIPGAEMYQPGDRVGAYRLESVADTFVVLVGEAGTRILRLQTPRGGSSGR